jgi:hypothetical protein
VQQALGRRTLIHTQRLRSLFGAFIGSALGYCSLLAVRLLCLTLYHEVPNPNITIRNFCIAVRHRPTDGGERRDGGGARKKRRHSSAVAKERVYHVAAYMRCPSGATENFFSSAADLGTCIPPPPPVMNLQSSILMAQMTRSTS